MRRSWLLISLLLLTLMCSCGGGSSSSSISSDDSLPDLTADDVIGTWVFGTRYLHIFDDGSYVIEGGSYQDSNDQTIIAAPYYVSGTWSVSGSTYSLSSGEPIGDTGIVITDIYACAVTYGAYTITATNAYVEGTGVGAVIHLAPNWEIFISPEMPAECGDFVSSGTEDYPTWTRTADIPGQYIYFTQIPVMPE